MRQVIDRFTSLSLWKLALAAYYIALESMLLPFAAELYSAKGLVPSERVLGWMGDGVVFATSLQALRVALAFGLLAPKLFVGAALGLWLTRIVQLQINPFSLAPQEPVLLVLLALAPTYGRARDTCRPSDTRLAARTALSLSLFAAGWSKVHNPSDSTWIDGSALYWILTTSPLATRFGAELAARLPSEFFIVPSYLLLVAELSAPVIMLGRRLRRGWMALAVPAFALGPLFVDLTSVFAGLLIAIAFTFDDQSDSPGGISDSGIPMSS